MSLNPSDLAASHYLTRTTCALCESPELTSVIDLGKMGLAGGFLKPPDLMGRFRRAERRSMAPRQR